MKAIKANAFIEDEIDGSEIIKKIEKIGRVCYKSENNITDDLAERFIRNIIKNGHESVLEHVAITLRVICDRGVTHEIVRHRIAAYSQESTRYCNYSKDKFGNEITVIEPLFWAKDSEEYKIWENTMKEIEKNYFKLIELGATPQEARLYFLIH